MGNKVALITDSTAYIPRDWIDKYGIKVSPAVVMLTAGSLSAVVR